MITIRPFRGWRPASGRAEQVASPPYDVLSSSEARAMAEGNADSFLHIIKPEIDLPEGTDLYSPEVYRTAQRNWKGFRDRGLFLQDETPVYYLYRQEMNGHEQTGIVAASSTTDYFEDRIKKHEYTRPKKEQDRIEHMYALGMHPGPVFLTFKRRQELKDLVSTYTASHQPVNDFRADDGVAHTLWIVDEPELVDTITSVFRNSVPATYIADGHHRAAASSRVGKRVGEEGASGVEHQYFLSVLFPDDELKIIDYNRVIKDLNGLDKSALLDRVREHFNVSGPADSPVRPSRPRDFGMYVEGEWYKLTAKPHTYDESDPVKNLDVSTLSDYLIDPVLGIADQRTDERIGFVGGIRGLGELEKRVDSGEMAIAFSLYPVTIDQLMAIADAGMVMPPKSTWFEPKLRSGLVVHAFRSEADAQ